MRYDDAVMVAIEGHWTDDRVLHWAAREAAYRRRPLVVVHVWEWSSVDRAALALNEDELSAAGYAPTPEERVVHDAVVSVRKDFPALRVTAELGYGRVTPMLLDAADGASMLVLGARGSGGFAGLRLGSVSAQVAAHALAPVAVVGGDDDGDDGRPVIVGVDGSALSDKALWLGIAEARRTGGALIAVHGYRLPPLAATYNPSHGVDVESHRLNAEEVLDRALHDVEAEATDVKIERRTVPGPPARTLLDASVDAAALVVGCRGLGGFAGLLLGSVSQQVVAHAHCPVIVAR